MEYNEGDIFYTYFEGEYHLYKLLYKEADAYHVLCYAPFLTLPEVKDIPAFEVAIYHLPMQQSHFIHSKAFATHEISVSDLQGFHVYLQQTQEIRDYFPIAAGYYRAAFALIQENRVIAAIAYYSKAIDLVPDFEDAISNRAFSYMHIKEWDKAIADFKISLQLKPAVIIKEFLLGECFMQLGDKKNAVIQFESTLAIDPGHPQARDLLQKIGTGE